MKNLITLISHLRGAVVSTVVFTVILCGIYPLAVRGIGVAFFRDKADGSLVLAADGTVRGSRLIGQSFSGPGYFHSRPSAAGAGGYDASASGGSNLGPTSEKLTGQIRDRVAAYRTLNGLAETDAVPADAVTASGSGLDPHISPRNAGWQARRVAGARGLSLETVRDLIEQHTARPALGFIGEHGVNVLELNLALDSREP